LEHECKQRHQNDAASQPGESAQEASHERSQSDQNGELEVAQIASETSVPQSRRSGLRMADYSGFSSWFLLRGICPGCGAKAPWGRRGVCPYVSRAFIPVLSVLRLDSVAPGAMGRRECAVRIPSFGTRPSVRRGDL